MVASPFGVAVLRPASGKVKLLHKLLRDSLSIYPTSSLLASPVTVPFGALIPRDQLNVLTAQSASLIDLLNTQNADASTFESPISGFLAYLEEFTENSVKPALDDVDRFQQAQTEYQVEIGNALDAALIDHRREQLNSYVEQLERGLSDLQSRSEKLAETERAAEKAVSQKGRERLQRDFASMGLRETWWAGGWTAAAFILTCVAIAIPIILFWRGVEFASVTGLSATLIKTFIGLPLLVFAAYCGKVASQHRDTARHMNILVTQIDSVSAYVAELPDEAKDEVRLVLGKRAFSTPELAASGKAENEPNSGEVALLLSKALDIISKFGDK